MTIKYSVFISSVYNSLRDERSHAIDAVIKMGYFPIAMENVSFGSFEEIKKLIDCSDIVILLLGSDYGSTAKDGVSWTEKEYEFAKSLNKHIFALETSQLTELKNRKTKKTSDEKKQLDFVKRVSDESYLCPVSGEHEYYEKISTHINSLLTESLGSGWIRRIDYNQWLKKHPWTDIGGTWFSFHISNTDKSYLKIGTVTIEQKRTIGQYRELNVTANNYGCKYYQKTHRIEENKTVFTTWVADYEIYVDTDENLKEVDGIFVATKNSDEEFADVIVQKGVKKGIHIFRDFDYSKDGKVKVMYGTFANVGSKKEGQILLFREKNDRDRYLRSNYSHVLDIYTERKKENEL